MSISRKSLKPAGITNESGQPEIILEIGGLTLSTSPPAPPAVTDDATAPDEGPDHRSK